MQTLTPCHNIMGVCYHSHLSGMHATRVDIANDFIIVSYLDHHATGKRNKPNKKALQLVLFFGSYINLELEAGKKKNWSKKNVACDKNIQKTNSSTHVTCRNDPLLCTM